MRITFLDLAQRYVSRRCETRAYLGVPRMGKDSAPVPASSTRRDSRRLGVEHSVVLNWLMRFRQLIALHEQLGNGDSAPTTGERRRVHRALTCSYVRLAGLVPRRSERRGMRRAERAVNGPGPPASYPFPNDVVHRT